MVGEAARLTRAIVGIAAASMTAAIVAAPVPSWLVDANCRDGQAQGPYQLRTGNGQLRVVGAFNEGMRTGSFIFWTANGVRAAHVPYDNNLRNGTVALWYDGPSERSPHAASSRFGITAAAMGSRARGTPTGIVVRKRNTTPGAS